ncbi:MAG: GGDEF domain-containing protein [Actinomycetota bacterium]|nr:GGDEF domain-containing protein [Actinomycetota bacterium]MDG1488842.1 GGDEF domain-containing protein [Actinomycetota bacterium]MDG2119790.1 GGDEF domain-containing protein [Actinomycetota bacterium]
MTARRFLFFYSIPISVFSMIGATWFLFQSSLVSEPAAVLVIGTLLVSALSLSCAALGMLFSGGRHEAELAQQAFYDPVTGRGNRVHASAKLEEALAVSRRSGKYVGLIFCDLNNFKMVNDIYGHSVGDELLRLIAGRFAQIVRPSDTVARFGGDEFIVVCPELRSNTDIEAVRVRLAAMFEQPFSIGGYSISVSASLGLTVGHGVRDSGSELLKRADAEMYRVKLEN